jgi:hypothetical protein
MAGATAKILFDFGIGFLSPIARVRSGKFYRPKNI